MRLTEEPPHCRQLAILRSRRPGPHQERCTIRCTDVTSSDPAPPMSQPDRILKPLDALLARRPPGKVYFCGRRTSPPPSSYVVNFPRLELPLRGRYELDLELDGR